MPKHCLNWKVVPDTNSPASCNPILKSKLFFLFGVGLGANILTRLARRRPKMINGLISVNCDSQSAGWMEWIYSKICLNSLKNMDDQKDDQEANLPLPKSVIDYLIWYHLGNPETEQREKKARFLNSSYRYLPRYLHF